MAGKKITELSNKSGVIQNHKTVIADSNGIAYQTDYLGSTTGATLSGDTAIFNRNDGNHYILPLKNYKVYTAQVTFNSGGVINLIVMDNTIGDGSGDGINDIQWVDNSTYYSLNMSSAPFLSNKTWIQSASYIGSGSSIYSFYGRRQSNSEIRYFSRDKDNNSGVPFGFPIFIEIRIYN